MDNLDWNREPIIFINHLAADGSYECGGCLISNGKSGISTTIESGKEMPILGTMSRMKTPKSDAVLHVYDFDYNIANRCLTMAVEPLMPGVDGPITFESFVSEADNFDYFFTNIPEVKKYIFSPRFKSFLQDLVAYFVDGSEKGVFMRATVKNIVLNSEGELKIFDISSHFRTLKESINSIQDTVSSLLKSAKMSRNFDFLFEVGDFVDKSSHVDYETMAKHPALLGKGEKTSFVLSVQRCITNHNLILDGQPSILVDWRSVVAKFDDLYLVLHYASEPTSPLCRTPDISRFLEYIRNVHYYVNNSINQTARVNCSPLLSHGNGTKNYKDSDVERMFDILFPRFLCFLHHYGIYHFLDAAR